MSFDLAGDGALPGTGGRVRYELVATPDGTRSLTLVLADGSRVVRYDDVVDYEDRRSENPARRSLRLVRTGDGKTYALIDHRVGRTVALPVDVDAQLPLNHIYLKDADSPFGGYRMTITSGAPSGPLVMAFVVDRRGRYRALIGKSMLRLENRGSIRYVKFDRALQRGWQRGSPQFPLRYARADVFAWNSGATGELAPADRQPPDSADDYVLFPMSVGGTDARYVLRPDPHLAGNYVVSVGSSQIPERKLFERVLLFDELAIAGAEGDVSAHVAWTASGPILLLDFAEGYSLPIPFAPYHEGYLSSAPADLGVEFARFGGGAIGFMLVDLDSHLIHLVATVDARGDVRVVRGADRPEPLFTVDRTELGDVLVDGRDLRRDRRWLANINKIYWDREGGRGRGWLADARYPLDSGTSITAFRNGMVGVFDAGGDLLRELEAPLVDDGSAADVATDVNVTAEKIFVSRWLGAEDEPRVSEHPRAEPPVCPGAYGG